MKIAIKRQAAHATNTMGVMEVDGAFYANTLEDTYRDLGADGSGKVPGQTCIPAGTYKVTVDFSEHFGKKMLHILDVPFFEGIRIHGGNTDADTEGCPLIGAQTNGLTRIWECAVVVDDLTERVEAAEGASDDVTITITNDFLQAA